MNACNDFLFEQPRSHPRPLEKNFLENCINWRKVVIKSGSWINLLWTVGPYRLMPLMDPSLILRLKFNYFWSQKNWGSFRPKRGFFQLIIWIMIILGFPKKSGAIGCSLPRLCIKTALLLKFSNRFLYSSKYVLLFSSWLDQLCSWFHHLISLKNCKSVRKCIKVEYSKYWYVKVSQKAGEYKKVIQKLRNF